MEEPDHDERVAYWDETGATTRGDPVEIDFVDFEIEETKIKGGMSWIISKQSK